MPPEEEKEETSESSDYDGWENGEVGMKQASGCGPENQLQRAKVHICPLQSSAVSSLLVNEGSKLAQSLK